MSRRSAAVAPTGPLPCLPPGSVVSFRALATLFRNRPSLALLDPAFDMAVAVYWCYLCRFTEYIDVGLFDASVAYVVRTYTGARGTPFVIACHAPAGAATAGADTLVVSMRGTRTMRDLTGTLLRRGAAPRVPSLLSGLLTADELASLTASANVSHGGILNHGLKCAAYAVQAVMDTWSAPAAAGASGSRRVVHLYGHSLGAASAVIAAYFVARTGLVASGDVRCCVLACPPVFMAGSPLATGHTRNYRHYYTTGDAVVELVGLAMPARAGLYTPDPRSSRSRSLYNLECPMPRLAVKAHALSPSTLIANHTTFMPVHYPRTTSRPVLLSAIFPTRNTVFSQHDGLDVLLCQERRVDVRRAVGDPSYDPTKRRSADHRKSRRRLPQSRPRTM
jgi:hypothetical protein